tara:strand:+ start:1549 stop:1818 length:270 start_codon:yes stop_codon:yes gene_type:complete
MFAQLRMETEIMKIIKNLMIKNQFLSQVLIFFFLLFFTMFLFSVFLNIVLPFLIALFSTRWFYKWFVGKKDQTEWFSFFSSAPKKKGLF